jgi:hypothetical protein
LSGGFTAAGAAAGEAGLTPTGSFCNKVATLPKMIISPN